MIRIATKLAGVAIIVTSVNLKAADLKKALSAPIAKSWTTKQDLDETERCLVMSDGPSLPYVYKQADQPNRVILAYSAGVGVPLVVEVTRISTGARIDVRTGGRVPKSFDRCV